MRAKLLFFRTPAVWGKDGRHLKQHDVWCLLFLFYFFNSWSGDLWLDKCLKLFFFSNGDNLNTPHSQRVLFSLFLSSSCSFCSYVSLSLAVLLCSFLFSFLFQPACYCYYSGSDLYIFLVGFTVPLHVLIQPSLQFLEIHDIPTVFLSLAYLNF